MTIRLMTVLICAACLTACDGGAARGTQDGERAGREAGARDGAVAGANAGRAEGTEAGANLARGAARRGEFGEIYVMPFFMMLLAGVTVGVGAQWLLLQRMRHGEPVDEHLVHLLIPGFSRSGVYAVWRAYVGLPPESSAPRLSLPEG